jgi:hypothetical protein
MVQVITPPAMMQKSRKLLYLGGVHLCSSFLGVRGGMCPVGPLPGPPGVQQYDRQPEPADPCLHQHNASTIRLIRPA